MSINKTADAMDAQLDASHTSLALEQLKKILLVGAGAGMAARGVGGFMQMLNRNSQPAPPPSTNVFQFPVPGHQKKEEKIAEDPPALPTMPPMSAYGHKWWAMPAHFAGAVGATVGGYKLMDYLLDQQRHKGLNEEVNQAKSDFEKALGQQPIGTAKRADDKAEQISQQLDEIFDVIQKRAEWGPLTGGILATMALPVLAGSGYAGYRMAKNDRQAEQLEAAVKERQRRRQQASAPFAMAVPETEK